MKVLIENKKALYDYDLIDKFQAGIVLTGMEVKSLRLGKATLKASFIAIQDEEVFLLKTYITPYQQGNTPKSYDPERKRKLLLTKKEIRTLIGKTKEKGLTLIPLRVYTNKSKIKVEFALAKSKKKHDKRRSIKEREQKIETQRAMKGVY